MLLQLVTTRFPFLRCSFAETGGHRHVASSCNVGHVKAVWFMVLTDVHGRCYLHLKSHSDPHRYHTTPWIELLRSPLICCLLKMFPASFHQPSQKELLTPSCVFSPEKSKVISPTSTLKRGKSNIGVQFQIDYPQDFCI